MQVNQNKQTIVGVIYRSNSPPCAYFDLFMSKILEFHDKISNENKTAYLMGDYNINLLTLTVIKNQLLHIQLSGTKILPTHNQTNKNNTSFGNSYRPFIF